MFGGPIARGPSLETSETVSPRGDGLGDPLPGAGWVAQPEIPAATTVAARHRSSRPTARRFTLHARRLYNVGIVIELVEAGRWTTIQDRGRPGLERFGI